MAYGHHAGNLRSVSEMPRTFPIGFRAHVSRGAEILAFCHSLLFLRIAMGFAPVAKQLVASNSALRTESFYGFLASGEGFTAKARQFRQLQGCIPKFFCGNRETICESNAGIARHSFIVTPTLFRNKRRKHPLNATGRQETSGGYWCHGMLTLGPPVLVQCY